MKSQAERRNAGTGNVGVLGGFDAAHAYGTEALAVLYDRHAAFGHAVQGRCTQGREAPAVDAVLVHLALAAARGGRAGGVVGVGGASGNGELPLLMLSSYALLSRRPRAAVRALAGAICADK